VLVVALAAVVACGSYFAFGLQPSLLAALATLLLAGIAFAVATRPFAVFPPAGITTFRDLANQVLTRNYATLSTRYQSWNPGDVWNVLKSLIVLNLGVSEDAVTKDSRIVEDLGAD
jgi:hypothetical protein